MRETICQTEAFKAIFACGRAPARSLNRSDNHHLKVLVLLYTHRACAFRTWSKLPHMYAFSCIFSQEKYVLQYLGCALFCVYVILKAPSWIIRVQRSS